MSHSQASGQHWPIVIIGAGFGGIGMAITLRRAGISGFTILERDRGLGGTWLRNTYPGAACDVPSSLYCYSFAPNPHWSRKFGAQPEILAYLKSTAQKFDVVRHMQFGAEVQAARFDESGQRWEIDLGDRQITAETLISSVGVFDQAQSPQIAGLDDFQGTRFHSLHWDHRHSLAGKNVAVIGTGASAVQFIPEIQPQARKLMVFQRTPPWVVPRMDRRIPLAEQKTYHHVPFVQSAARKSWYAMIESFGLPGFVDTRFRHPFEALGRLQLRRQVRDPELRRKLTPDYMIGCKRAIFSDNYYPALCQPNVQLITDGIKRVGPRSIHCHDGTEHAVDTLIFGTGFATSPVFNSRIHGVDGRSLDDCYRERPQSYFGVAQAGFPNFFTILGRFGAGGNQSAIFWMECQFRYITDAITRMRQKGIKRIDVRAEAQEAFVDEMHARSTNGTWLNGACRSYYTNDAGMNAGLYPNWSFEYARRLQRWNAEDFVIEKTTTKETADEAA